MPVFGDYVKLIISRPAISRQTLTQFWPVRSWRRSRSLVSSARSWGKSRSSRRRIKVSAAEVFPSPGHCSSLDPGPTRYDQSQTITTCVTLFQLVPAGSTQFHPGANWFQLVPILSSPFPLARLVLTCFSCFNLFDPCSKPVPTYYNLCHSVSTGPNWCHSIQPWSQPVPTGPNPFQTI